MDDTISGINSDHRDKNEQAEEKSRVQGLSDEAKQSSELQEPNVEGNKPQELSEQVTENRSQEPNEQAIESSKLQGPNVEDSKPQELSEQVTENRPQEPNEQAKESSELQGPNVKDGKPQELSEQVEENKAQGVNEQASDDEPQELKDGTEEKVRTSVLQFPGEVTSLPPLPSIPEITLTELQPGLDEIPHDQAKDGQLQDLKEGIEGNQEVLTETPAQQLEDKKKKEASITTIVDLKPPTKKKQKDSISHFSAKSAYSTQSSMRNLPVPSKASLPRAPPPKPKPETVDKGTQCKLMLMRKLQLFPKRSPPQKGHVQRAKPPTADKATQINSSPGKRPPVLIRKKRTEETTIDKTAHSKTLPGKTRTSIMRKGGSSCYDSISTDDSMMVKKGKKAKAIYNFHITIYEGENEMDSRCKAGSRWAESASSSGLSKACTVFSTLKAGMIHTSDLLLTLHTLGILVTNVEMCRTLRHVKVTPSGTLDFYEFLEVVNQTSPFTDTEDFQTILWVFRKINKGMVAIDDLESVLIGLGVNLSNEEIQQTLACSEVRNGNVNILNFLQTAWELQRGNDEEAFEYECDTTDRNPFHDVTELVNAEARWRKRYCDEDFLSPKCLVPLMTWSCSNEDIIFGRPQRRVSWKSDPITVIYPHIAEAGDKDRGIKPTEPQLDVTVQRSPSTTPSVHNIEGGDKDHETMEATEQSAAEQTNILLEEEEEEKEEEKEEVKP